ncbi:MAG: sodium:proton antiporter [Lachnospiraceae bacterium]|jgi:proton-translocating NADH-quinone oxidoreductase chain N|nr:sodium:proton antiporter [Lachnospiraceae bacterium]
MNFVQNFPAISILLCLFAGIISSGLKRKAARGLSRALLIAELFLNGSTLLYVLGTGEAFVYVMGKFPAPWGNEIRAGVLEALVALFFCIIMFLSLEGGVKKLADEVEEGKTYLYYVLCDLLLSSLLALVYTNDLFTAYVFVEINTIAACGLIMIRQNGRTIEAAARYMIMSLLGSGLLLMGICMLYDLTGHLLMSNIKEQVAMISEVGEYRIPLLVAIALISVGLSIKSALFPFHAWLPDAYGYSTVSSAAILSSLVSKGYIFLLFKIVYRVIGFEVFYSSRIIDIFFIFGLMGMIFGSLSAIKENDIRRMIAFSSVAQIGYIYMGIGMGTQAGMSASVFHILSHAATKSLLFIAAIGLTEVSDGSRQFIKLTGAAYRNKWAGVAFTMGALSMVGVPLFSGFISKLLFAQAAVQNQMKMLPALIVLGISTILNAIYFMKTVIRIYTPVEDFEFETVTFRNMKIYAAALVCFIALNVFLGVSSQPIVDLIEQGLAMFS